MLTAVNLVPIVIAIAIGSFMKGVTGFGFALMVSPILLLLLPPETAIPLIALLVLLNEIALLITLRRDIHLKHMGPVLFSALLGVPLGVLVFSFEGHLVPSVMAVVLILITISLWRGHSLKKTSPATRAAVGFIGGLMHGIATIGSPFVVLLLEAEHTRRKVFRANLILYTTLMTILAVLLHTYRGLYTPDLLLTVAILTPVALAATWLGDRIEHKMNRKLFDHVVLGVVFVASLIILIRSLVAIV